ncbi:sensor histidine kinase [Paenibacillus sp. GYB003]|uniref:sensor histidine kinase n=1 Tax=Paenibacillus sp. GYB003 TaxID=2994392 RepID=UPI002F96CD4D
MVQSAKISLILLGIIMILTVNILLFYNLTKDTLYSNNERELQNIATHIQSAIEQSRLGSKLYEDMIGEKLRAAAVAAEYALPKDVEKVTNEQLVELRDKLMLQDLTLLKKTKDNIVLYKSSDPRQIGLETKGWGNWYKGFQELFETGNVTMDWGQKLPNYWSGPYEVASSNTKQISKWGYYYSGSTNYIIDPYVDDIAFDNYQNITGINAILENTLKTYPFLIEIAGINPATFGNEKTFITQKGEVLDPLIHRPVFFGEYTVKNTEKDAKFIDLAIETNQSTHYVQQFGEKKISKTFIPVLSKTLDGVTPIPDPEVLYQEYKDGSTNVSKNKYYVLTLTSDVRELETTLNSQFRWLIAAIVLITVVSILLVIFIIRVVSKARDKAVKEASVTYMDELRQMYLDIRGQRHDFLNHVNVIHSFVELRRYDDLNKYTQSLIEDTQVLNDIINIGQPEIAAIIQSKTVTAMNKKISFSHDIKVQGYSLTGDKSVDLVRIIGNLVDNAFDEVQTLPNEKRWVKCKGWVHNGQLHFEVINPLLKDVTVEAQSSYFKEGFTTKEGHSGLGLWITKRLVQKNRGEIHLHPSNEIFNIKISIPVS